MLCCALAGLPNRQNRVAVEATSIVVESGRIAARWSLAFIVTSEECASQTGIMPIAFDATLGDVYSLAPASELHKASVGEQFTPR